MTNIKPPPSTKRSEVLLLPRAKRAPLTFKIASLWGRQEGSTEKYQIDESISFPEEKDLNFSSNFKAEITFVKLKNEISVSLNNAEIELHLICPLCLTEFQQYIKIPSAEREFLHDHPDKPIDPDDIYFIDTNRMGIDLSEMVRQEIILHLPFIPVCFKGCKGLCATCGKNKNHDKCKCKDGNDKFYKPFKNLKKIILNSYL